MFSKYLRDPEATANAHDADGYFKTGDSKSFVLQNIIKD
jgi:long-subunit acyl-CoA synthetase (AMP-forming)